MLETAHLHEKFDELRDRFLNDLLTMLMEQMEILDQIKMQTLYGTGTHHPINYVAFIVE